MRKDPSQAEVTADAIKIAEDAPHPAEQPEMPLITATALREGVAYVDAGELLTETLKYVKASHDFNTLLAQSLVKTQQSLIRAHRKLIELESDMADDGIGGKKSALIIPERLRN